MIRRRYQACAAAALLLTMSACTQSTTQQAAPTATGYGQLNGLSADDILGVINSAGMPTPNAHDVTADKCPKLHCVGAIDSDTVSILKFDHSGAAQAYAGAISNIYQVEDLVLVFTAGVTAGQKSAYEQAVQRAVA